MHLLFYSNSAETAQQKIQSAMESFISEESVERYHRVETFLSRLKQPTFDITAVVVMPDKAALFRLAHQKELLSHLRIILILPDMDQDTLTQAHQLYPRFITYWDDNLNDVAEVLKRMNHHTKGGENG